MHLGPDPSHQGGSRDWFCARADGGRLPTSLWEYICEGRALLGRGAVTWSRIPIEGVTEKAMEEAYRAWRTRELLRKERDLLGRDYYQGSRR
jgi:hypothetical protein